MANEEQKKIQAVEKKLKELEKQWKLLQKHQKRTEDSNKFLMSELQNYLVEVAYWRRKHMQESAHCESLNKSSAFMCVENLKLRQQVQVLTHELEEKEIQIAEMKIFLENSNESAGCEQSNEKREEVKKSEEQNNDEDVKDAETAKVNDESGETTKVEDGSGEAKIEEVEDEPLEQVMKEEGPKMTKDEATQSERLPNNYVIEGHYITRGICRANCIKHTEGRKVILMEQVDDDCEEYEGARTKSSAACFVKKLVLVSDPGYKHDLGWQEKLKLKQEEKKKNKHDSLERGREQGLLDMQKRLTEAEELEANAIALGEGLGRCQQILQRRVAEAEAIEEAEEARKFANYNVVMKTIVRVKKMMIRACCCCRKKPCQEDVLATQWMNDNLSLLDNDDDDE